MTAVLARLRQAARWTWALLIPVGAVLVYLFARRKTAAQPTELDAAIEKSRRMRLEAEARATVEIAMARTRNITEVRELAQVLRDADQGEDAQVDELIEVGRKIREGK